MDVEAVSRKLGRLSSMLAYVGACALFVMMCLTTADVVGRYIFNSPILGVFELFWAFRPEGANVGQLQIMHIFQCTNAQFPVHLHFRYYF